MKEEDNKESIGGYLKRLREQLGFTLQDIASKTKISLPYLEHLENENFSLLPNEVFIKGFLRSYAKVLGLGETEILDRFQQWKSVHQADSVLESEKEAAHERGDSWPRVQLGRIKSLYETKKGSHRKILVNLLIGVVLVLGGLILFSKRNLVETELKESGNSPSPASNSSVPVVVAPATAIPSTVMGALPEGVETSAVKSSTLHLTVQAVDRSWISVVVDDGVTKEFSLHPDDKISLDAEKRFLLNIGNAGGVKLTLNGKPIGPYGKKGEIVKGIKLEP